MCSKKGIASIAVIIFVSRSFSMPDCIGTSIDNAINISKGQTSHAHIEQAKENVTVEEEDTRTTTTTTSAPVHVSDTVEYQRHEGENPTDFCIRAFWEGLEPGDIYATTGASIPPDWVANNCQALFCGNSTNNTFCEWTKFAIDTIVPSKNLTAELCNTGTSESFLTDPFWARYQFSDFYKGKIEYDINTFNNTLMYNFLYTQLPDGSKSPSPASKTQGKKRLKHLHEAIQLQIQKRSNRTIQSIQPPNNNTLVIHLRLGDVIDYAVETVKEQLLHQTYFYKGRTVGKGWNAYVRPLQYYTAILPEIRQYESIVIMGAAHQGQIISRGPFKTDKSCLYTRSVQRYLQRLTGTEITLRLGEPPDDDIMFVSQAKGFLPSGGGFSDLLGRLQELSGGTVIGKKKKNKRRQNR